MLSSSAGNTDVKDTIAIAVAIIGLYGAVLSTYNAWKAHRKDKADVRLHIAPHMSVANDPRRKGMTFLVITAANVGSRPVTITHVASSTLDSSIHNVLFDVQPRLPCQLTEGQQLVAFVDEAQGGLDQVESWYVVDSAGRKHHKHIVAWHRRLLSKYRRRKTWAAKRKAANAEAAHSSGPSNTTGTGPA
jgi:hypothetical protein